MDLNAHVTHADRTSYKFRDSDTLHAQSHPFTALKLSNVKYLVQEAREKGFFFVRKILPGDWLKQCSLFDDSAIKCLDRISESSTCMYLPTYCCCEKSFFLTKHILILTRFSDEESLEKVSTHGSSLYDLVCPRMCTPERMLSRIFYMHIDMRTC